MYDSLSRHSELKIYIRSSKSLGIDIDCLGKNQNCTQQKMPCSVFIRNNQIKGIILDYSTKIYCIEDNLLMHEDLSNARLRLQTCNTVIYGLDLSVIIHLWAKSC